MFSLKKIVLGTVGYSLITFPLAYVWHLVVFKSTYEQLNYFSREEPIVVFGFFAILLQGVLLSVVYPFAFGRMSFGKGAIWFVGLMGGYHWSMHVLSAAAKNNIAPLSTWFAIESVYLAIQFALGGLLLACIYRQAEDSLAQPA